MWLFKKTKPNDAFMRQVFEHQGILHKIGHLYAQSDADREDLFQEMLLQLWRAQPHYQQSAKFTTWMYQVCLNTAISGLRKSRRWYQLGSLDKYVGHFLSSEQWQQMEHREELALLQQAIAQLSEVEKAIIHLHLEENSYEEIAHIMGITTSNVGVKLNRIKAKLAALLKPQHQTI
jgi:RNA polymerase sigma factor (sigma-70 family)